MKIESSSPAVLTSAPPVAVSAKRPSIADVARTAGVAVSTASRILHGGNSKVAFSPATRQRVQAAAGSLHYLPSFLARNLRRRFTRTAAILFRYPEDAISKELTDALNQRFSRSDIHLVFESLDANVERTCQTVRDLSGGVADAVFIWPNQEAVPLLDASIPHDYPLIHLGRQRSTQRPYIAFDRRDAARIATTHLLKCRGPRVGYVGPASELGEDSRYVGYLDALKDAVLVPPPDGLRLEDSFSLEFGERAGLQIARLAARPDALFVASDFLAIGVIAGLTKGDARVPEDIGIAAYDGIHLGRYTRPPLTTMAVPLDQCAERATVMLQAIYNGKTAKDLLPMAITLQASLVIRESCGARIKGVA